MWGPPMAARHRVRTLDNSREEHKELLIIYFPALKRPLSYPLARAPAPPRKSHAFLPRCLPTSAPRVTPSCVPAED